MARFNLHIIDGKEVDVAIDAENPQVAIDAGIAALAQFAFRNFPPPENLLINISNEHSEHIATVSFAFKIELARQIVN